MRPSAPVVFLSLVLLTISGCAGYQVGSTTGHRAGEVSAQVVPFHNQTLEPRLGGALTAALRKELQRDGTYALSTTGKGDLIISGEVTQYQRQEQTLDPADLTTARDYKTLLTAHVIVRERASGRVILDETLTGNTLIRVGNDLVSTERQALPLLATDLARRIVGALADGSW